MNTTFRSGAGALVIDLDRDLLRGNLGAEMFWTSAALDWRHLFKNARGPLPDARRLPYDPATLTTCIAAQDAGREIVLADSGRPRMAAAVAEHLSFVARVIPGHAPPSTEVVPTRDPVLGHLVRQLRPHQWVKNILVFLPLIAAHAFTVDTITNALLAFCAFGLIASAVYVLNDLADLDADRRHHTKKDRPFASGRLPLRYGMPMFVSLLVAGFAVAFAANPPLIFVLVGYFFLTTAYSMRLKGMLALDIVVLAMLYTMRIVAGAAATGINPSVWLLSFSIFLFLSLAAVKRLAELVELDAGSGPKAAAGRAYTVDDRPIVAMIATSSGFIAVLVMALYLDTAEVRAQYDEPMALWGIGLILLFWVSRIVLLAHRGLVNEDPVVFALTDRMSRIVGLAMAGLFVVALIA
jgi:4-hydroxybenzoate polyprenyltransferase